MRSLTDDNGDVCPIQTHIKKSHTRKTYTHTHTHMHTKTHTYKNAHRHTHTQVYSNRDTRTITRKHACIKANTHAQNLHTPTDHTFTHTHTHTLTHACMRACARARIHTHAYRHIDTLIFIYIYHEMFNVLLSKI